MNKLERVKEALENLIAMFDEGVPENEWDMVKSDGRKALAELNEVMEELESKEFKDYMELSLYSQMCTWYGNDRDFEEGLCKELAQEVINIITGKDDDKP